MILRIAHLYPKLLNLYGDWGNILTLKQRMKWRGIDVEIELINENENFAPSQFDLFFIGGGQDKQQIEVSKQLQKYKTEFQEISENGAVFLGICGGYQLLGKYYAPFNGEKLNGISLLDCYTIAGKERFIGNVSAICEFITPEKIVGFENHSGLTYLEEGTVPLAKIEIGSGNNNVDRTEGARKNNVFGTYLHGSFLPKNPQFADLLIKLALQYRYNDKIELSKLNDDLELKLNSELFNRPY